MNKWFFVIFIIIFKITFLKAQITKADYYNKIDNKVFTFSKEQPNAPFDTIASFVNQTFQSSEDRARAYYTWIALNIEFNEDYRGSSSLSLINVLRDTNNVVHSANNAMETKSAASEGAANLLLKFCQSSKITCYTVPGYIRRPDRTISNMLFVWNVLLLDSVWVQIDASMTNGYLNDSYKFIRHPMQNYFCMPPLNFVKDHFPHDPMWQLLKYPFSMYEFDENNYLSKKTLMYSFLDSLKEYQSKTNIQQKEIDINRYFIFETNQELYNGNLELFYYEKATDIMGIGIDYYEKYYEIGNNKLSKYPLKSDWQMAKKLLDKAEYNFIEAEKFIQKYPTKITETHLRQNFQKELKNNMINIKNNQQYLEKLKPHLKDK